MKHLMHYMKDRSKLSRQNVVSLSATAAVAVLIWWAILSSKPHAARPKLTKSQFECLLWVWSDEHAGKAHTAEELKALVAAGERCVQLGVTGPPVPAP